MKAMWLAFVVTAVVTVAADFVLDEVGFTAANQTTNNDTVRLSD